MILIKKGNLLQLREGDHMVADKWKNGGIESLWQGITELTGLKVFLLSCRQEQTNSWHLEFTVSHLSCHIFSNNQEPFEIMLSIGSIEAVNAFMEITGWLQ